eukprot:11608227-Karenia_brevis.AAC.1
MWSEDDQSQEDVNEGDALAFAAGLQDDIPMPPQSLSLFRGMLPTWSWIKDSAVEALENYLAT